MVDARDVRVRMVRVTLASPMAIAFVTDDQVALLDPGDLDGLGADDDALVVGDMTITGAAEQLQELIDEARRAPGRDYLELGDLDIVRRDGGVRLNRLPGKELQGTSSLVLAAMLEHERNGWINREVEFARWTFPCGDNHFVTSPLRARFMVQELATALG